MAGLSIRLDSLDLMMPMHLAVSQDGRILRTGPTLRKLRPDIGLQGAALFDLFDIRRPRDCCTVGDLLASDGGRVSLSFREGSKESFKGLIVPLPCEAGGLLNLSFGFSVIDAVRNHDLTAGDFASTDLAVEMLYLVEAKSAALHESRKLNLRLQGAKVAAEEQAFTDTLTGLKNRRALDHVLKRLIDDCVPFGMMHVDLDFFKQVNDTYGHAAGDEVLQVAAQALAVETRDTDTVARLGGDEFVIIFKRLTDAEVLTKLAKRLIARIEQPVPYHDDLCCISASVGITTSLIRPGAVSADTMLKDADVALYRSKAAGRGRCTVFSIVKE
ncbi:GGDEF domain-containing protein [Aliiruegeria haliotis]|nr:diguanylate cyclase [Aliiruegeria haliotis]